MDIEKLIEQLKNLEACAYGYHINGEVLGMDCSDFEQVMVHAADEISKVPALQAENEKLRAELEQMAACVYYKQVGLCRYGEEDPANAMRNPSSLILRPRRRRTFLLLGPAKGGRP